MTAPAGDEAGGASGAPIGEVRSRALVVVGVAIGVATVTALVVAAVWATFIID